MRLFRYPLIVVAVILAAPFGLSSSEGPARAPGDAAGPALQFEANRGQADASVRFLARRSGYTALLTPEGAVFLNRSGGEATPPEVVRMRFCGASRMARIHGREKLEGVSHYLLGRDPKKWVTNVPHFGRVVVRGLYAGVDLHWREAPDGGLRYDLVVAPGVDPDVIALSFEGARSVEIDHAGGLEVHTGRGLLLHGRPTVFQEAGGVRQRVAGRFVLRGRGRVAFEAGPYDASRTLVIDPTVEYSTYHGGEGEEAAHRIAVDETGAVYLVGETSSLDFFRKNPVQGTSGGGKDAFVSKLDPEGKKVVFSTFLGGSGIDLAHGVAVDGDGSVYVTGDTESPDFPLQAPLQDALSGDEDAFVAKLAADGSSLEYSTYLGGSGSDRGWRVAVDGAGAAWVVGVASSPDFPTRSPLQPAFGGDEDGFVAKLDAEGSALLYSTYFGGSAVDHLHSLALGASGAVYVAGHTESADFPTRSPLQATLSGGQDACVAKISPDGATLEYSTYLGGGASDEVWSIAVDSRGAAYVTGRTESGNFPTEAALQAEYGGTRDAFVSKIDPAGSALDFSTYLGGSDKETGRGIAVDRHGVVHVAGNTKSRDFTTRRAVQETHGGGDDDAFLVKLNAAGSALAFSSFWGGDHIDRGNAIALDRNGAAYVTGRTYSTDFPTESPLQIHHGGLGDVFVYKIPLHALDLVATKGSLRDREKAAGDKGVVKGTFTFNSLRSDEAFDPAKHDSEVLLGSPGSPLVIRISAGDPGWKARKDGTVLSWKSAKKTLPKVKLVLNMAKGKFKFKAGGFDFPALQASPIRVELLLGENGGWDEAAWSGKKPGSLKHKLRRR